MKVVTIVGTRPELIKLSEVIRELDKHVDHILVHTGQNYDYELNEIFYKELEIRKPDYFMNAADEAGLMYTIANILTCTDKLLEDEKPDAVLILGDTNSCLSAYVAKRRHIPIFHMEAGNRCFDERVPEEINRKIIDHISDINMVYTEHARRYLIQEGLKQEQIIKIGSPMWDVIHNHYVDIMERKAYEQLGFLESKSYYLVSCHREENVDDDSRISKFIDMISYLATDLPVVISTHPRLRANKRMQESIKYYEENHSDKFIWSKPFGFIDYCSLQVGAKCVISDSGTITEEAAILGFPAVTIRQAHERPEGMDVGTLVMADLGDTNVMDAINLVTSQVHQGIPLDYNAGHQAIQIVRIIMSYIDYINRRTWYKNG
jgi:UDP-N-acetylglucosamine 2-epimerase (non-hydrolysing)